MVGPFRDYLFGLSVLALAMGGYQMTVARWLKPPVVQRAPIAERELTDNDESLVDLYPADAWQRGRSIRLKTQDGMLLFQNWEQNKGDRDGGKKWRLWPITMVIGRGLDADGDSQPIVIEAEEGAVIEFSAALDVMSGVAPTIQRGQLMGSVHIRRINGNEIDAASDAVNTSIYQVNASKNADETLDIRTANVGIDRRKIWTTEAIHMQVGRALMVGRDLTLHLASSAGGGGSQSSISRSLDRMELIYLRELTLPLDKPGASPDDSNGIVQVKCDGRIEYDFALDQLLLDQNVQLLHSPSPNTASSNSTGLTSAFSNRSTPLSPTALDGELERFECESLRLTLRDPLNSDRTRETALDWIDRIEAVGSPVRLSMPSQGFDLNAGKVLLDPVEGWLIAEPGVTRVASPFSNAASNRQAQANDQQAVQIRNGELSATLSRIVYRFDPKHPRQLGTVEVEGAGLVQYTAPDSVLKSFQWLDSLRVSPLDVATPNAIDVNFGVWCDGGIQALLSDGGSFVTDRIEGVIKPIKPSLNGGSVDHQWFPDRFSAIGNVQVRSPTLVAATQQMNLFFEQKNLHPATAADTQQADPGSVRRWVSQPDKNTASTSRTTPGQKSPQAAPATIRGDQVTAKLTFGDRELTATDLSVVGNVEVTHPLTMKKSALNATTPSEPMIAVLTGDHLRIRDGGGSDVLQLGSQSDRPARLDLGDGYFIGPEIQVRPDDNYVWIPSAGEFLIPSEFLPSLNSASSTSASRWSRSPHCRFGGSMTFDGQVAKLSGGVDLQAAIVNNGQPSEIRMNGDELQFVLENPVSFRTPASFQATRLAQVSLLQTTTRPVVVRVDQFAGDGIRQSRHEMTVASLNWMPGEPDSNIAMRPMAQAGSAKAAMSGYIVAPGPGSYRGWIRGKAQSDDETSPTPDSGNTASVYLEGMIEDARPGSNGLGQSETIITGVHLVFQEAMRGDLMAKSLEFSKGVRIGRRILPDFDQTFEATEMDHLAMDEMTLDCDRVRLSIDPSVTLQTPKFKIAGRSNPSNPPALEVEASGGVVFRSRTERGMSQATADRCGYAIAKDLVTIEGIPGRPARFQQTDPTGKPLANLAIRTMTLRLKPFQLISSQVESFQTGALPASATKSR
ncbi:hypothetical protein [Neorhodopirellula lusitana]|uniref:hypothetical protein n=1 Tax=Neorhodopirellula lusitana TaxID=445327 RepID=UPI00384FCF17